MLKLLPDENFDNTILRGLLRRQPDIDIIRVQDTEFYGANDPICIGLGSSRKSDTVDS